tara:strand:- start:20 stop:442 length:423 start_codon:yes stop_codon:yes gene_type:complete
MPAGRPSDYCEETARKVCEGLESGLSLRKVCEAPDMPSKTSVFRWLSQHEEFRDQYARAREIGAEVRFDELEELAATATPESVSVVKLQVDTRKWALSKMQPRKYGDKVTQEITGEGGGPIKTVTRIELAPLTGDDDSEG